MSSKGLDNEAASYPYSWCLWWEVATLISQK